MVEVIQPLLAPAIMFSAGGLLCMAQFARYTAVLGQIRNFNRERLVALQQAEDAPRAHCQLLRDRAQGLEHQTQQLLAHANTIRNALRLLVGGILLMVLCSLTIGASLLYEPLSQAALGLFVLGLLATFGGLCLVMVELRVSLDVVRFEHGNLARLRRGHGLLPPDLQISGEAPGDD